MLPKQCRLNKPPEKRTMTRNIPFACPHYAKHIPMTEYTPVQTPKTYHLPFPSESPLIMNGSHTTASTLVLLRTHESSTAPPLSGPNLCSHAINNGMQPLHPAQLSPHAQCLAHNVTVCPMLLPPAFTMSLIAQAATTQPGHAQNPQPFCQLSSPPNIRCPHQRQLKPFTPSKLCNPPPNPTPPSLFQPFLSGGLQAHHCLNKCGSNCSTGWLLFGVSSPLSTAAAAAIGTAAAGPENIFPSCCVSPPPCCCCCCCGPIPPC